MQDFNLGVKECTTMSLSELLKQCRKQKGISQAELASKLGVTQQAVGKWESGKSSPDPATVARIAEILSTTADFLLGLYRPVSNAATPEERFFGNYAESLIPVIGTVKAGYGALAFEEVAQDRKSTRLNSSHLNESRMPSSA